MLAFPLVLLCVASPSSYSSPTQDRLFMVGRQNRIYEIHYTVPQGGFTELVTYQGQGLTFPSGLEVDRSTGEFLVLTPDWLDQDGFSEILRVDPITGQTNAIHLVQGDLYGLEQGVDGEFFSTQRRDGGVLVRIDLVDNTSETLNYNDPNPESLSTFYSGLAIRPDGLLEGGNVERWTIDPASGDVQRFDWGFGPPLTNTGVATSSYEIGPDGTRYIIAQNDGLLVIDPDLTTAALRNDLVGPMTVFGLCFDSATHNVGLETVCEGSANSLGQSATLEFLGTPEIAANSLELYSRRLPGQSFGYFVTGPNIGSTPVGSGVLCIASPVARYSLFPLNAGEAGVVRFDIDLFSIPSGGAVVAGRTDLFQYWYRDDGATSNLSDALSVTMR